MSSLDMVQCTIHTTTCGGPEWTWQISLQELEAEKGHAVEYTTDEKVGIPGAGSSPAD